MRAYYLSRGRKIAPVIATLVYDRLLGLMALIVLAFTGLGITWIFDQNFVWSKEFQWGFLGLAIAMGVLASIYGLTCWPRFLSLTETYLPKIPLGGAISRFISGVADLSKYGLLTLGLLGISMGPHISSALALYFTGQAFGLDSNFWLTLILAPLIFLSGVLPLSPNNIGWTEYLGSLIWASQGSGQGADLWMGYRLVFILVSLSGLLVYLRFRAGVLPHES